MRYSYSLEEILVANSTYTSTSDLKKRLLNEGLIEDKCYVEECPLNASNGIWCGSKIVYHLDHINGIHNDHRLENLRLLCPNCHSQTETWCGRNRYVTESDNVHVTCIFCGKTCNSRAYWHQACNRCIDCGKQAYGIRCKSCDRQQRATPISWPSVEEVVALVTSTNYTQAGKKLGATDNALRKFLKRNGYSLGREPKKIVS